jgi:hypothetical protein
MRKKMGLSSGADLIQFAVAWRQEERTPVQGERGARLPGAKSLRAALGISPEGPSRLTLLFISPADDTHSHLAFLSSVCTLFRTDAFADALLTKKTPPEVLDYLRQSEIPG